MKYLLLAICLAGSVSCFGQDGELAIAAVGMNIVYKGIPNTLIAVAAKYSCKSLLLTTDNGILKKLNDCYYSFDPTRIGMATIVAKHVKKRDTITIGKCYFRVREMPLPEAAVGGKFSGSKISATALKVQIGLAAELRNFLVETRFEVKRFTLTLIRTRDSSVTIHSDSGAYFTKEIKELINTVRAGDRIVFSGISADGSTGKDLKLLPLELTIE